MRRFPRGISLPGVVGQNEGVVINQAKTVETSNLDSRLPRRSSNRMRALVASFVLALAAGCVHARPCKCICSCRTATVAADLRLCVVPKELAERPPAKLPPSYLRQLAGAVQRLEQRRSFDDELALQEARQVAEGLAHPEQAAREGKAVMDLAELERKLAEMVRP